MNQQHQATPTTRPVVIQVSGASDTSRKNDNQSSNQPQFVTLSTTGGQEVIISGNEGIEGGHQILTSGHVVQGATVQVCTGTEYKDAHAVGVNTVPFTCIEPSFCYIFI